MPRGNRTGPNGMGPMTGRAAGYCAGNDEAGWVTSPGFAGGGRRMGFGRGFGRGYGRGYARGFAPGGWYEEPVAPENRKDALRSEAEALEGRLSFLRREIEALEGERKGSE